MSVYASTGVPHSASSYSAPSVTTSNIITTGNLVINPTGDIDISGKRIVNAASPANPNDGVTKSYADDTYTTAPSSAVTDSAITLYDGTTGKLLKQSPITINPSGVIGSVGPITITPGTSQPVTINSDTRVNGNLLVNGTTTTINTNQMLVTDNSISLNTGYTSTSTRSCGIVSNYSSTGVNTTVSSGGFTAGVAGVSNPNVAVSADVFVSGDIIQVSGANKDANNGIFEVLSNVGGILTINGVGISSLTYDLFQSQFVTDATVAGVIHKINTTCIFNDGPVMNQLVGSNVGSMVIKKISGTTSSSADQVPTFGDSNGTLTYNATGTPATMDRPLTITTPTVSGTNVYTLTAQGTVNGSGRVYMQAINNAVGNSSAGLFLGKPFVGTTSLTWEFGVDSTVNNTDDFYIRHNRTNKNSIIIGSNDVVTFDTAMNGPRYDITTRTVNPGSTNTLWSFTGNILRFGASGVVTTAATTTVNTIPAFSTTGAVLSTTATTTPATLSRPITISAGNTATAATFNTTNANCSVIISTTSTSRNRGVVTFGRSAVGQWTIGSDKDSNNSDNFFIFRSGAQCLTINGVGQLVTAGYGFSSTRYDCEVIAANPGGTTTLWNNSSDGSRLYHGANRLAYASEIGAGSIGATSPVANGLVSFADASPGNVKSPDATVTSTQSFAIDKTTTTLDTLFSLKRIGTNTTGIVNQILPAVDASIIYFNGYQDVSSGIQYFKSGKARWALVNDCNLTNDLFKIERTNTTNTLNAMLIDASDGMIQAPLGIRVAPSNNTSGYITVGPGTASSTSTTVVLQALTGGAQGLSFLSFNGYYNNAETRFNTGKNRWRFMCDQRSSTDTISLDTYNGTTGITAFTVATTGLTTFNQGSVATRRDLTSTGSNPGSTNTLWYNSGSDSLRAFFGANKFGLFIDSPNGNKQIFTTAGTFTITLPSPTFGFTMMHIFIMGGGGGGAGGTGIGGGSTYIAGGGGGSAGAFTQFSTRINTTDTYSVIIGVGGVGGNAGNAGFGGDGGIGAASSFRINNNACITVAGGTNGTPGGPGATFGHGGSGSMPGGGGAGSTLGGGGGGTCQLTAQFGTTFENGQSGDAINAGRGAFGGGIGGVSIGGIILPGGGGGGPFGGPGTGNTTTAQTTPGQYGCGGGGGMGYQASGNTGTAGGAGGDGFAIVWYT